MSTIVIVPGATAGAWQFGDVTRLLRRAEHDVYPLTLTGLGDRSHLAHPDIDLDTHITDVVNAILWEQLEDVVLLGASYGGVVITGVAEKIPQRIAKMIYLDAVIPQDGQSLVDAIVLQVRRRLQTILRTKSRQRAMAGGCRPVAIRRARRISHSRRSRKSWL